jgi:hypothetical protein
VFKSASHFPHQLYSNSVRVEFGDVYPLAPNIPEENISIQHCKNGFTSQVQQVSVTQKTNKNISILFGDEMIFLL